MLKQFFTGSISLGSDPEGFFVRDGRVIGSEKLIPKEGLRSVVGGWITRDGVQFELHPDANKDIRIFINNVGNTLLTTFELARNNGASVCFDGMVTVLRKELDSLEPESRILGCTPSTNVYGDRPIMVDPVTYRKRSAGGHVHIGLYYNDKRRSIPLYDILLGNTCVVLDRDKHAAERRENYGRAGECRFPMYGLEYRTLSNFWLRDPNLALFVFQIAQFIATLSYITLQVGKSDIWNELAAVVNIEDIQNAINTNDYKLAKKNLNAVTPFILKYGKEFGLTEELFIKLETISARARKGGIEYAYPNENIVERWTEVTRNIRQAVMLY